MILGARANEKLQRFENVNVWSESIGTEVVFDRNEPLVR
jgi:hypothetical protein